MNGFITLGRPLSTPNPPQDARNWSAYKFPVIAPLWADVQMPADGAITVTVVEEKDMAVVNEAFNNKDHFKLVYFRIFCLFL